MTTFVYVGPSMSHEDARNILDAEYLPPVKRGDLQKIPDDVDTIVIIDGVLLNDAAVGHREIISLLNSDISVIGGGSMGALRAAELDSFGMKGVGRIYEEYRSGRVDGDDEVVLAYDPFSLAPLSEPLINFRINLYEAVNNGAISKKVADEVMIALKNVYYPHRTSKKFMEVISVFLAESDCDSLLNYWNYNYKDYKNLDARLILEGLKNNAKNLHF